MKRSVISLILGMLVSSSVMAGTSGASATRVVWFDLMSKDVARATQFYGKLFGWQVTKSSPRYSIISASGQPIGGLDDYAASSNGGVAIYFEVEDIEATLGEASGLGARVLMPVTDFGAGKGRMAMFADRDGNPIGLISFRSRR